MKSLATSVRDWDVFAAKRNASRVCFRVPVAVHCWINTLGITYYKHFLVVFVKQVDHLFYILCFSLLSFAFNFAHNTVHVVVGIIRNVSATRL